MANSINCNQPNSGIDINFNGNIINSNEFWLAGIGSPGQKQTLVCVETTSNVDDPTALFKAQQEYTSCYDCVSNNYGLVEFRNCFQCREGFCNILVDVSAFTESQYLEILSASTSGSTNQIFYIQYENNGILKYGCFSPAKINVLPFIVYNDISQNLQSFGQQIVNNLSYTAQTDCQSCLTGSSVVYAVQRCNDDIIDFVYLPYSFTGKTISYTDGINEFCGVVIGQTEENPGTYTFLTDYGKDNCETCLLTENKKVLIQNCVNSGEQYVVWASQLFGIGDATNFEAAGGCYQIIGETILDINAPSFLDFEPHAGCNSCLTCNGVNYEYAYCEEPSTPVGVIKTNQILVNGYSFIEPISDKCCVILNPTTSISNVDLPSVQPCDCEGVLDYQVFPATECLTGFPIGVLTDMNAQDGDIVKIMYGEVDFLCVQLNTTGRIPKTFYNSERDVNGDTIIYNGCDDCTSNSTIGVRAINCDTQELDIVDINYSAYTEFIFNNKSQFNPFGFNCIIDSNGFCRTVVETCPQPPVGNLVTPSDSYYNCPACRAFNPAPIPPRSEGSEYTVCVICCECGATGSTVTQVSPPHPVWTDAYGTSVTQLNMVTLGGNGLNS